MPVTAMGACYVIVWPQGFADSNGDGFLAYIEVGKTWHESASIELVHRLFE
jgi:hypothetical protein